MKLGFIGYGSLGRQIERMLAEDGLVQPLATTYFDDDASSNSHPNAVPFDSWQEDKYADFSFVVALGYKELRIKHKLFEHLLRREREMFSAIHSSATISPSATIGRGVVIFPGCVIDQYAKIGDGTVLYSRTTIAHDCRVGKSSFLAPSVTLAGNVTVGDRVFIGSGTCVANTVQIADDCIVGIGSVITHDLSSGCSAIGNPIRILSKRLKLR